MNLYSSRHHVFYSARLQIVMTERVYFAFSVSFSLQYLLWKPGKSVELLSAFYNLQIDLCTWVLVGCDWNLALTLLSNIDYVLILSPANRQIRQIFLGMLVAYSVSLDSRAPLSISSLETIPDTL